MTEKGQEVLRVLNARGIAYEYKEHQAIYTMEEMQQLHLPHPDAVAKNLFLRDKKHRYYLLSVRNEQKIDLKRLKDLIGSKPLSFASEQDLEAVLNLEKGSVTPFGVLNGRAKAVSVFIDEGFRDTIIGIHPNTNTATVWLSTEDLISLLEQHGSAVSFLSF